jgi:hypothetical protein
MESAKLCSLDQNLSDPESSWIQTSERLQYRHTKLRSEETTQRQIVIARYCRFEDVEPRNYNLPFPTHRARAVYHEPSLSVRALAYFSKILSKSFVSTAMSDRYGLISSAFQRSCVRKRSANHMVGRLEVPHKGSIRGKWRRCAGVASLFSPVIKGPEAERGEWILTVGNLRDVLEMKVSPTAVFHFVMNSSSDIGLLCK